MIPFLDLKSATDELREELDAAYHRFMDSGWYVLGTEVEAFECEYAAYCEVEHCVGVGNGLDALILALRAIDIGPGDEVIVPSNTYIATWLAVTEVGATIVPVEPNAMTHNIDPNRIADALTGRTKVIMPVNLYGQPVDYDTICEIAHPANIKVVTDNAQTHGARYRGRRVGGIADIECHSFYPSKNLGAFGEAGAVTTNNATIANRIKLLRNYGSRIRYYNEECGLNSRLDALQAAFLRVKLRHLDTWNHRRRTIANLYRKSLAPLTSTSSQLLLPFVPEWADPVWHLFVVRSKSRDKLRERLQAAAIGTQVHYPVPPHLSKAYQHLGYASSDFPIASQLAGEVLSIPMGPHLNDKDAKAVANALAESCGKIDCGSNKS